VYALLVEGKSLSNKGIEDEFRQLVSRKTESLKNIGLPLCGIEFKKEGISLFCNTRSKGGAERKGRWRADGEESAAHSYQPGVSLKPSHDGESHRTPGRKPALQTGR
jgi:hypothetical protein